MRIARAAGLAAWLGAACSVVLGVAVPSAVRRLEPVDYARDVEPILQVKCQPCHAGSYISGGLDIASPAAFVRGGDSGPVVIPGESNRSPLLQRIRGKGGKPMMPLSGNPLSPEMVSTIARWVDEGADMGPGAPRFAQATSGLVIGFDPKVWGIFKASCTICHNSEAASGGLDLTSEKTLAKGGVSGPVVVPGEPDKSKLLYRLTGSDGKPIMPLGFKPLSQADRQLIMDWIRNGAKAGEAELHWSYRPIVRPTVPDTGDDPWPRNDIDRFVLDRLQEESVEPSPEAEKETLLRRLSYDLTGLPPTLEEIDTFLSDASPDAYERQVDRLLASPHYGERRALFWLDLARYADTNGFEADRTRTAWLFRDYVIQAFNENTPFDRFTREQLAGDLLPDGGIRARIATGFLRNSMFNEEGGVDPAEGHFTVLLDRADAVASVWLGSTLECARCHDHKYDPFTQEDYYSFLAYFNNSKFEKRGDNLVGQEKWYEPTLPVPAPGQAEELARADEEAQAAKARLDAAAQGPEYDAWVRRIKTETIVPTGQPWRPEGEQWKAIDAGAWRWEGTVPERSVTRIAGALPSNATGVVLEALPDPQFQRGGPGLSSGGNFIVTSVRLTIEGKEVPFTQVAVSFSQPGYDASLLIGRTSQDAWAIYPEAGKPHRLVMSLPNGHGGGRAVLEVGQESAAWPQHLIGKLRVTATMTRRPAEIAAQERLESLGDKELRAAFLTSGALGELVQSVRETRARFEAAREAIPNAMVVEETPHEGPPKINVRERGAFLDLGKEVTAAPPSFLPDPRPDEVKSRLGLAEWLTREDNPLVARVQANRIWAQFFGRGLSPTLGDLGTKGIAPSQPELLDFLASEFAANWDTKALIRSIVTSATYRQSSRYRADLGQRDPENDLLARMPRLRLEAEAIRDTVLSASGLLNPKIGGRSVFPFQPDGVWNGPYSGEVWTRSSGTDSFRRGIYTFWKRTATYPAFELFDAPNRQFCVTGRQRSNTPLQALAMLNDPFVLEASRAMARATLAVSQPDAERFRTMFRRCTSRMPDEKETDRGLALLHALNGTEAERWTLVANTLLNLDETRTRP
ncbi:MAG: PSD1 and planctomycete cytochrome C domain-containing protein [Fimbriimonadaceae bacterium]